MLCRPPQIAMVCVRHAVFFKSFFLGSVGGGWELLFWDSYLRLKYLRMDIYIVPADNFMKMVRVNLRRRWEDLSHSSISRKCRPVTAKDLLCDFWQQQKSSTAESMKQLQRPSRDRRKLSIGYSLLYDARRVGVRWDRRDSHRLRLGWDLCEGGYMLASSRRGEREGRWWRREQFWRRH